MNPYQVIVIFLAKYLIFFNIFAFTVYLFISKSSNRRLKQLTLVTLPAILIFNFILNHFIYSPRPFVVRHIPPLVSHAPDNSFPSSHTLLAAGLAALVFLSNRKLGLLFFLLAVFIGLGRVLALLHFPQDIIFSLLLGPVLVLTISYFIHPE